MSVETESDIPAALRTTASQVDRALRACLDAVAGPSAPLVEAMRYSVEAGGKRLRPVLTLWSCEACGGKSDAAMPPAVAVELVHTFSLIHDDLPAIDDDDVRRGVPASHVKFGEAAAILAGDALFALAFETLARDVVDPATAAAMIRELAEAAGAGGMIGGEAADLDGESRPPDADLVARIHGHKTARLFQAACRLGALAAGADARKLLALGDYGYELGLAFQAVDDLLDAGGRFEKLGKPTGRDGPAGKQTYLRAVGMEAGRRVAQDAARRAVAAVGCFGERARRLVDLARFVVEREA